MNASHIFKLLDEPQTPSRTRGLIIPTNTSKKQSTSNGVLPGLGSGKEGQFDAFGEACRQRGSPKDWCVFTSRKHAAPQQAAAAWGLLCFPQNEQSNSDTKHSHRCWRSPCLLANSHYFVTLFSGGGRKQRLSESRRQTDVKWKVRAKSRWSRQ